MVCVCVCVQMKQFARAFMIRNDRTAFVFVFKVHKDSIGRMHNIFVDSGDFPQIVDYDSVILNKADVRMPAADQRSHNAEALVSFCQLCQSCCPVRPTAGSGNNVTFVAS